MLAPGRFSLRFEPRKMHARISESAPWSTWWASTPRPIAPKCPCVLEEGQWRVEIPLPPLLRSNVDRRLAERHHAG